MIDKYYSIVETINDNSLYQSSTLLTHRTHKSGSQILKFQFLIFSMSVFAKLSNQTFGKIDHC